MRLRYLVPTILLVLLSPVAVAAAAQGPVEVTISPDRVDSAVGDFLNIRSTVTNTGTASIGPLIAHLNVASLEDVYVDLEDWTAAPTQSVDALAPGRSTEVSWDIQAVNAGAFKVYSVVLPHESASLVVSPPVHVDVAGRRTLSAGGALPVALAIPLLLGLGALAVRRRLRATA
jgi:hypothetical protein